MTTERIKKAQQCKFCVYKGNNTIHDLQVIIREGSSNNGVLDIAWFAIHTKLPNFLNSLEYLLTDKSKFFIEIALSGLFSAVFWMIWFLIQALHLVFLPPLHRGCSYINTLDPCHSLPPRLFLPICLLNAWKILPTCLIGTTHLLDFSNYLSLHVYLDYTFIWHTRVKGYPLEILSKYERQTYHLAKSLKEILQ